MRFLSAVKSKYASASSFKKPVTANFEDETFELTDKLKEALKKHKMLDQVIELEDGEAKLTPSAAKELDRTYKLFTSEKSADEKFEEVETVLKDETEAVIKKVAGAKAHNFKVHVNLHIEDKYVVYDGASAVVEIHYMGDEEEIDSVYTKGESERIGDTIESWPQWAFWLLDDVSPLHSLEFTSSWKRHEIAHTLSELLSYEEQIDDLKEKAEKAVKDLMARNDD